MSKIIIRGAAIGLVAFSLISCSPQGQSKSTQTKVEEANVIEVNNQYCPVTGEKIKEELATTYVYQGKRYRFCCVNCIIPFKRDPQKYIKIIEEGKQPESSGHEHMH